MPEPITLLQSASPAAPVLATVETEGTTVYLYLNGAAASGFESRTLWVANLAPAPQELDLERMKRGEPPLMPAAFTRRPDGVRLADLEPFRLVWFPEGTGAALYGKDGLLAILPPGTNEKEGFAGFARDCARRTQLAWPMEGPEAAGARAEVERAEAFWEAWEGEKAWPALQKELFGAIDQALGSQGRFFNLGKKEDWPPSILAVRRTPKATVLVTGGASIRPQPGVARPLGRPQGPRRIELAMALRGQVDEAELARLGQYLADQSHLPWLRCTWLGPGHTLDCDVVPVTAGRRFPAVIVAQQPRGAPTIPFPDYEGDPVQVLWLIPIGEAERELARKHGSRALLDRLQQLGDIWAHGERADLGLAN